MYLLLKNRRWLVLPKQKCQASCSLAFYFPYFYRSRKAVQNTKLENVRDNRKMNKRYCKNEIYQFTK